MAVELSGSAAPLALGEGYRISVPGRRGTAGLQVEGERAVPPDENLDAALERAQMQVRAAVVVSTSGTAPVPAEQEALAARLGPSIVLEAPQQLPGMGQIVLAMDQLGGISWHLPDPALKRTFGLQPTAAVQLFLVPIRGSVTPQSFGVVGKMLLKVLMYPLFDAVLGPISEHFARQWEGRHRPYGIRTFTPANYRDLSAPEWTRDDWARVASGPALLFIHGGASTATGAFHELSAATMQTLYDRYESRLLAFNHPTMTEDPQENARWFLKQVPAALPLRFDIVCHSRGGIVARELIQRASEILPGSRVAVGAAVFVGVPNAGTEIFDVDRLGHVFDRLSTAAKLCPGLPAAEWFDAIIVSVKLLAHGLLAGMPGIRVLVPGTAFLKSLNLPGKLDVRYHAIAADYDPPPGGPLFEIVKMRLLNQAADRVFEKPNDLVVPTDGVGGDVGGPGFPIEGEYCLRFRADEGVMHTTYFRHPDTSEKLLEWLEPKIVNGGLFARLVEAMLARMPERIRDTVRQWLSDPSTSPRRG
jgi:hypothetical protein